MDFWDVGGGEGSSILSLVFIHFDGLRRNSRESSPRTVGSEGHGPGTMLENGRDNRDCKNRETQVWAEKGQSLRQRTKSPFSLFRIWGSEVVCKALKGPHCMAGTIMVVHE